MFSVYMVACADNTFYIGIAKDLSKRIHEHNTSKRGARYTKTRRPVTLVYYEECESLSVALKREHSLKKLTRKEKEKLIKNDGK